MSRCRRRRPATPDLLVAQAIANRPELAALRSSRDAAYKFADAEKDLSRPTVSAVAVGGFIPLINTPPPLPSRPNTKASPPTSAFPCSMAICSRPAAKPPSSAPWNPISGFATNSNASARDVRVAWASANDAYQRIDVTAQFLRQAALALDLAQGRYDLGLASIVELTQAQLNLTQAEIENLNAKYDYQTQYAALQFTLGLLR